MKIRVRSGQAGRQDAGQGLVGRIIAARGEHGIIGPECAAADKYRAVALADAGPDFLHAHPGIIVAYPAGFAIARGNAAIEGGGQLEQNVGAVRGLPDNKIGSQVPACLFVNRPHNFHAMLHEPGRAAGSLGIWVWQTVNKAPDSGVQQGFDAWRRLALVPAGLQGYDHGGPFGVHAGRVPQAVHFRMGLAKALVPALSHDFVIAQQYRADHGIGAGPELSAPGQFYGLAHIWHILQHYCPFLAVLSLSPTSAPQISCGTRSV